MQARYQVLPDDPRPWYRVPHLIKLNLLLLIPLVSSGAIGYDGTSRPAHDMTTAADDPRVHDERPPDAPSVAGVLRQPRGCHPRRPQRRVPGRQVLRHVPRHVERGQVRAQDHHGRRRPDMPRLRHHAGRVAEPQQLPRGARHPRLLHQFPRAAQPDPHLGARVPYPPRQADGAVQHVLRKSPDSTRKK